MNKKRLTVIVVVTVVLTAMLLGVSRLTTDKGTSKKTVSPATNPPVSISPQETQVIPPSGDIQTVTGEIICLPKPGNGPQTMECAIGMKADNQKNYALKNNPKYDIPIDTSVVVTGTFTPPETDTPYDIVGTIDVKTIEKTP